MKRSRALAALSRDHHQALQVALTLRRADAATAAAAVERFRAFFADHAAEHFAIEEGELVSALLPSDRTWAAGTARMTREHRRMRELAADLDASSELDAVAALGTLLHDHVRFEERELFPYLERRLDDTALDELERRMAPRECRGGGP